VEDRDYGVDLNEFGRVIETADVLIIRFAIVDKRLLIDARTNEKGDGPFIAVVPKAASVEDRFKELKKLRPRFPLPEKIMSFTWPRHIDSFRTSGVPERIEARLVKLGGDTMAAPVRDAVNALAAEEKSEVLSAIRGDERYQTIWQRAE
jgi:hypothetical protein